MPKKRQFKPMLSLTPAEWEEMKGKAEKEKKVSQSLPINESARKRGRSEA